MSEDFKERDILIVMRKVLTNIIKETTPGPERQSPFSEDTIQDIRMCLGLIVSRERELADEAGTPRKRPYFTDEPQTSKAVTLKPASSGKGREQGD